MPRSFIYLALLTAFWLNLFISAPAYASDYIGCLFCHQYPGLVKKDEKQRRKTIHIDPQSFQQSSHGKLGCRDCHQDINKIPHVSTQKIDCKSGCHESTRDQELLRKQPLKDFHKGQQSFISELNDQGSCKVCHSVYSHSQQPFIRAWLNMHGGYLVCESCHLKNDSNSNISYQWTRLKGVRFSGKPFGSFYQPQKNQAEAEKSSLSRIAPGIIKRGEFQPLINTMDVEKARAFKAARHKPGTEKSKKALEYFHRKIRKMDSATACKKCHKKNGLLDFTALGFSRERAEVLENTHIDNIISNYQDFYIPRLF